MLTTRFVAWMVAMALMVFGAEVSGQDFPNKTIRIFGGAAGGGSDFMARLIAQGLSSSADYQVIVENRPSGFVSAEIVSKAPPDGYTLTIQGGAFYIVPLLRKAPYDPERDFAPILLIATDTSVLVVHASVPVKSVSELIALAKAKPGALNYGSSAIGANTHLAAELFKFMAGVNIVHVPYNGQAPAVTSVLSGETQMLIAEAGLVAAHVKSGKLRALAVTSAKPSALAPGLPAIAETLPGYESVGMTGMLAPAKTPPAIINQLNREIVRVLNLPEVKERFLRAGSEIVANSPEEFAAWMKRDAARMGKVIKDAGIKTE